MTIYLTKTVDGKTHHFRIINEGTMLGIVQGIFYIEMGKTWQQFSSEQEAQEEAKKLIDQKIKEGYQVTPFSETAENNMDVYDMARWHYGGDFPEDLDEFQGYVHTGMFLGWLIEQDLVSSRFKEDLAEFIQLFKERKITGAQIFEVTDGALLLDDISEIGNRFALYYFNIDTGEYLKDYENILGANLPSLYHVQDTWENYFKLKEMLDSRYEEWQRLIN